MMIKWTNNTMNSELAAHCINADIYYHEINESLVTTPKVNYSFSGEISLYCTTLGDYDVIIHIITV